MKLKLFITVILFINSGVDTIVQANFRIDYKTSNIQLFQNTVSDADSNIYIKHQRLERFSKEVAVDTQILFSQKSLNFFGKKQVKLEMRELHSNINRTLFEATIIGRAKLKDLNNDRINELIIQHKLIELEKTIFINLVLMRHFDKMDTILIREGYSYSLPANNLEERFEPGDLLSERYFIKFGDKNKDGYSDIKQKKVITRFKPKECSCDDNFNYKVLKNWLFYHPDQFPFYF